MVLSCFVRFRMLTITRNPGIGFETIIGPISFAYDNRISLFIFVVKIT